ncbi:formin-like protein 11 [Iris pallida]|uniref:Formin-like protein n=1 Tax=Iris pallida TaxID=29817 RepID=A0AAX6DY04_IRIPA|nr:formin-like protein 11 [Iris pallida]
MSTSPQTLPSLFSERTQGSTMGCSSCYFLCLLVLVSAPASAYNGKEEDVEKVPGGEDNGMPTTRFSFLLRMTEVSRSRRQTPPPLSLSPAPAPTEEAAAPTQAPVSYTNIYNRQPLYHKSHYAPALHSKDGGKARHRRTIVAIVVSVGVVLLVMCGVAVLVVYKRCRRRRRDRPTGGNSKVSYDPDPDPGPEMFYLNVLAPILEIESTQKQSSESKNALSSESLCASASSVCPNKDSLPTISRPRSSLSSESVSSSRPLHNGETTKCKLDVHCTGFLNSSSSSSEEDESFHSVCNSHSSDELLSVVSVSEASLSCPSGKCSPFSSSSRRSTTSSESKPTQFPPINPPLPPASIESKHPSPKFEAALPSHADDDPKEEHLSELEMTSLICASSPGLVSSSPLMPSALEATKPPLRNGNIPTPPPPPLPPSRAPSSTQSGGSSTRNPAPPPPPCLPQQRAAVGKDGTRLPKLKPLHWDKVRATPDHSMVWDKIRSSSFELDEQMIESLFRYKAQSNAEAEEAKNKNASPPSKHVLDHKRLQNITILMKALNATAGQVREALMQGGGLSARQLEALAKMVPTKEEEEKLANFKGDTRELGTAEALVRAILDIPFAFSRIQVMLYRETFQDEVVHLKKSFAMLEEACKELRSSRLFFRLLEAVLKTGNRMNVGTIRGGARAFKLDTLLKLADVKGTDGKTTLLHFVVQEIVRSEGVSAAEEESAKKTSKPRTAEEREEYYRVLGLGVVSGLSTELCNVKKTASVDLDVLASSVSNLSEGMKRLKRLVEVDMSIDEEDAGFANATRSFSIRAEETIDKLKEDEDRVLVHVREITEYYHGEVGKDEANPLRIFVIVRDFVGMLDRVCKELGSSRTRWCASSSPPFR